MESNKPRRWVQTRASNWKNTQNAEKFILLSSLGYYYYRYFRVNKSIPLFVGFTVVSWAAANGWARFAFIPLR